MAQGQAERAARLLGAATALYERIGAFYDPLRSPLREQEPAAIRLALQETDYVGAWETGRALSVEEAIAEAEALADASNNQAMLGSRRSSAGNGLSPREREVLRLLVDGKSNREIGEAIFVSPLTVRSHVTSILAKLGVATRTEAAARAVREGLV